MRFIYTSDPAAKDVLLALGYTLLHSAGSMWVFDNPSGSDPELGELAYALSDKITF